MEVQKQKAQRRHPNNCGAHLRVQELVPPWMKDGEPEAARGGDGPLEGELTSSRASQTGSRSLHRSTPNFKLLQKAKDNAND